MDFEITKVPVEKLKPAAYNPRKTLKRSDKAYQDIKRAIADFGLVQNLVWNRQSGNLVAGHQRLKIGIKEFGWKEAPCVVVDLDDAKEKALNVLLNRVGEGLWSTPKLAELLEELQGSHIDPTDLGFDESEIEELLKQKPKPTKRDPDDAPTPPARPRTKPGDRYLILSADGHPEHRLICGSATETETYERLLEDHRPNLIFTDPPYGVSYQSKSTKQTMSRHDLQGDELRAAELREFLTAAFRCLHGQTADEAAFYCFFATREHIAFETALRAAGFEPQQELIWAKQMNLGRANYHWSHEPCLYGHKQNQRAPWYGDRCQTTTWQDDRPDFESMTKADLVEMMRQLADTQTVWDERRDPPSTYVHPCMPTGEPAFADGRWQPIEEIEAGQTNPFGTITETTSHTASHIVTITLEDGTTTRATGNHPFLIARGNEILWMEARHIQPGDQTLTRANAPATQKPCREGKTENPPQEPSPRKDTAESTTQRSDDGGCSTSSSGNATTDPSRPECRSTTETGTRPTIELRTSNLSMPLHTNGFTLVAEKQPTEDGKNHARHAGDSNPLHPSTGISRADGSTDANAGHAMPPGKSRNERFELRTVGSVDHDRTPTTVHNLTIKGIPAFDTAIGVSHNTQKPTSLVRRAIRHSTLPRNTVLDPFAGSGSTMIGAELERRSSHQIELEPSFCDAIVARYVQTFDECLLYRNGEELDPADFTDNAHHE